MVNHDGTIYRNHKNLPIEVSCCVCVSILEAENGKGQPMETKRMLTYYSLGIILGSLVETNIEHKLDWR